MATESSADVTAKLHRDTIGRRAFMIRAAVGLSMGPIGDALHATGTAAHEATPAGGQEMASVTDHYALADGDAEAIWFLGTLALIKGVGSQTAGALATVEFTHPAGFATPLHVHHMADEAFYVLTGAMRGICGDQEWAATTGSFVWLPRGVPHGYAVDGDEQLRTPGNHGARRLRPLRRRGRGACPGAGPAPTGGAGHREAGGSGRQVRDRDLGAAGAVPSHPTRLATTKRGIRLAGNRSTGGQADLGAISCVTCGVQGIHPRRRPWKRGL